MHAERRVLYIKSNKAEREMQDKQRGYSPDTASKETGKPVELFSASLAKQNGEEATRDNDKEVPSNIAKSSLDLLYKAHVPAKHKGNPQSIANSIQQ